MADQNLSLTPTPTQSGLTPEEIDYLRQKAPDYINSLPIDQQGMYRDALKAKGINIDSPSQGIDVGRPGFFDRLQQANPLPVLNQLKDAVGKGLDHSFYGIGSPFTIPYEVGKQGIQNTLDMLKGIKNNGLEGVPVVGPLIKDAYGGSYGSSNGPNWPGLAGDVTAGALQIFGPEIMKGALAPERWVGDNLYTGATRKVVGMNPDIKTLSKFEDVVNYAKNNRLLPKDLEKNQTLIDQASQAKKSAISNSTAQPSGYAFLGPLQEIAKNYLKTGDEIPEPILDRMDKFSNIPSSPMQFWQDMKEAFSKRIQNGSPISGQDVLEKSINKQDLEASEMGLRKGIEQYAPGVDKANQQLHQGMLYRTSIENYLKNTPNAMETVAPVVAAALAHEVTPGMAGLTNSPMTVPAISALLTRAAIKNPQFAAQIGRMMSSAGRGPVTLGVGNLAKLGIGQTNTNQQR